jgi:hypothetical protein
MYRTREYFARGNIDIRIVLERLVIVHEAERCKQSLAIPSTLIDGINATTAGRPYFSYGCISELSLFLAS